MPRHSHFRIRALFALLPVASAAQSWSEKPVSQWNGEDARQVLAASPWVKKTKVAVIPARGESQLREGGKMGGAGVGSKSEGSLGAVSRQVTIRWESAMPVRTAELIAHEESAPAWDGNYYVVAVYDLAGISTNDLKAISSDLRRTALLKRDGKKDLKPSRVDVVLLAENLARIVYLFPRSTPISTDDPRIEFIAQIGRLGLTQTFVTGDMLLRGKLEL